MGLLDYEGAAWYERSFYSDGGTLRFCFGAVMTYAEVWLDGVKLGSHYGGFCAFEFIARGVIPGMHTLTVMVDNSFDADSIPQKGVDWYHYGGIIRSVTVEALEGISILSNRFEYTLSENMKTADVRVALELYNASDKAVSDTVFASVAGVRFDEKIQLNPGESKEIFTKSLEINGFELWSPKSPTLYDLEITTSTDDLFDKVGFRKVEVNEKGVLINGALTEIMGVNRHEEHPYFGFAFPPALMERDIDIAVNMGCNSLRGFHYPNDPLFVDMLDVRGILFWSEIPIWRGGSLRSQKL